MIETSAQFQAYATGDMRPLNWGVRIAFDKTIDEDITFFTIGESLIGGGDFIKGVGDVVQEWDKYIYEDFSERIMQMEWTRQVEQFASVTLAMADIVLDNHDDYFTSGAGSAIDSNLLPYRPIRLYAGFGDELIPVLIGLTTTRPMIDEKAKTATFHCVDYLYALLDRPVNEVVLTVDQRVDQILQELFESVGLLPTQLDLDEANTTIPFAYLGTNSTLRETVKQLMQVEQGRLYMNELGVIQFRTRQSYDDTSVFTFDDTNILDITDRDQNGIINVVEINGQVRELQPKQLYYKQGSPIRVPAESSLDVWVEFQDPVTSCDAPLYFAEATTSSYTVNTASDGSGSASTDVTLTTSSLFTKSYKMTFENANTSDLYITALELYATPAIVVQEVKVREQSDASVLANEEQLVQITNNFFQNQNAAEARAQSLVSDYSEYGNASRLEVKGTMALQLDDTITVNMNDNSVDYKITKIINKLTQPAKFTQIIEVKDFTPFVYFTIGVSEIGGVDAIAP